QPLQPHQAVVTPDAVGMQASDPAPVGQPELGDVAVGIDAQLGVQRVEIGVCRHIVLVGGSNCTAATRRPRFAPPCVTAEEICQARYQGRRGTITGAATPMTTPELTATVPATGYGRRQLLARLCHGTQLVSPFARLRTLLRNDLRILAYHRVLESAEPDGFDFDVDLISASAERFRAQMAFLRRHFHPMRFDEVLARIDSGRALPPRAVLVSFDDGYDDNHRVAFPILQDLGMSAMFFVS